MQSMTIVRALCIAALLACVGAQAQTNVYKWADKEGNVHFSDTPPPPEVTISSQRRLGGGYVETENLPYATQMAMKRNPVTLYVGADCGDPCSQGRDLLAKRGIPYSERDAQANAADSEALKKLVGGLDVPTLVVGEAKLKGYEASQWHGALDGAGYPRTRLPGQAAGPRATAKPPGEPAAEPAKADAAEPEARPQ
jgi:glutaredoxin